MADLILHHYPNSPFSEKIRRVLAYKGVDYRHTVHPEILPKPAQEALTGGYRKVPMLQVGSDIFLDSWLIAETLERLAPEPSLFPAGPLNRMMVNFVGTVFFHIASTLVFSPPGQSKPPAGYSRKELVALLRDRVKLMKDANTISVPNHMSLDYIHNYLQELEVGFAGSPYLIGNEYSFADFSLYGALWFVARNQNIGHILDDYPKIRLWLETISKIDSGANIEPIEPAAAVAVAAGTEPDDALTPNSTTLPAKFSLGETVAISATDYGQEKSEGKLISYNQDSIVIERQSEEAGSLRLHFPLVGYRVELIKKAKA